MTGRAACTMPVVHFVYPPGDRQPRVVRANRNVAQFAARACDSLNTPLSQPESHRAGPVGAPERPVFARRIAPSARSGRTPLRRRWCRERPPEKPRFCGAMGVPLSHSSRGSLPANCSSRKGGGVAVSAFARAGDGAGPAATTRKARATRGRGPDRTGRPGGGPSASTGPAG